MKYDTDPVQQKKDFDSKDPDYGNLEEKRVIMGSEQETARKLGKLEPREVTRNNHNGNGIVYDTRSNSISVTGFPDGQGFDLYLYSGVGQFITTISSRNPISVSTLPQIVSYIEIFASGQIVGSITLPIHM